MAIGAKPNRQQVKTGIFCLESWAGDLRSRRSVRPLLEILEQEAGVKFIHRTVDSRSSFFDLLARWPTYDSYRIGYIACHGDAERLVIGAHRVTLKQLETELQRRNISLAKRTLYFGSCGVLSMPKSRLRAFRENIGAEAVCGYKGDDGVDWLESAAFELLLFDYLTYGRAAAPSGLRDFRNDHRALWKKLDFEADPIA